MVEIESERLRLVPLSAELIAALIGDGETPFATPDDWPDLHDSVEVGYTIFPTHRRRGYATEAVRALVEHTRGLGVRRFVASVAPGNEPSLRLVRGLGFVEVGRHWDDEDGEELEFVLELSDRAT
jgi:RimJ/RimL family protein N-acetyltransferase